MEGERLDDEAFVHGLEHPATDPVPVGAYGRATVGDEVVWMAMTPNGHIANLKRHQVVEHDDGTITVTPSILVTVPNHPDPVIAAGFHGFLTRGRWEVA